jgi:cyanophycin synthetase
LVQEGLISGGFQENMIEIIPNIDQAIDRIFAIADSGDLLVIQPDELEPIMSQIIERYRQQVLLS